METKMSFFKKKRIGIPYRREENIFQSNIIHHLKEIDRSHDIVFIVFT